MRPFSLSRLLSPTVLSENLSGLIAIHPPSLSIFIFDLILVKEHYSLHYSESLPRLRYNHYISALDQEYPEVNWLTFGDWAKSRLR